MIFVLLYLIKKACLGKKCISRDQLFSEMDSLGNLIYIFLIPVGGCLNFSIFLLSLTPSEFHISDQFS